MLFVSFSNGVCVCACARARLVVQSFSRVQLFESLWTIAPEAPLWNSSGKNTRVGCHFLLQGIFLTQEFNPGLLHCRQMVYQLSYEGSPSSQEVYGGGGLETTIPL